MDVFLSHPHPHPHPHHPEHAFWAGGQVPMMGTPAQPNQVIYPILTLPENRPRLTREQWAMLEHHFSRDRKPTTVVKRGIAQTMNVPLEKINNWFQNRRAKERQEQKKAEAAARDGRPQPEPLNANIPVGDQQTLQIRPASQPVGPTHHVSSLTPRLSVSDSLPSQPQSTMPSPSEDLGCGVQTGLPTSVPSEAAFEPSHFVNPLAHGVRPGLPMTIMPSDNLSSNDVYPSPDQTVFSSPDQFQVASQSVAASASQSPEGLHPIIPHEFSEGIAPETVVSSGPVLEHIPFVSNDSSVPDIAFPNGHPDSIITSAVSFADYAPFFDGLSVPSTPTFPGGQFDEQYQSVSSQAVSNALTAASEFPGPNATYLELPFNNDMLNASSASLPTTSDHQSLEQFMPPPDAAKLFKPRQSSQPNLAARRRKNAPGAILVNPIGSMGRSGSYTAGMPHPISPRSPHLAAPDQTLRRIKSSNNTTGRIQKPMTPAQRSPLVFAFTHNNNLLDNQTPPPSAPIVETPSVCNVAYPNVQSMFPPEINFNMPWSAPPTQQTFMLPMDGAAFSGAGVLPSTPSPTSQPQHLPS